MIEKHKKLLLDIDYFLKNLLNLTTSLAHCLSLNCFTSPGVTGFSRMIFLSFLIVFLWLTGISIGLFFSLNIVIFSNSFDLTLLSSTLRHSEKNNNSYTVAIISKWHFDKPYFSCRIRDESRCFISIVSRQFLIMYYGCIFTFNIQLLNIAVGNLFSFRQYYAVFGTINQ